MTAITPTQFRENFKAFTDDTVYTDQQVQMYLDLAYNTFLRAASWKTAIDYGAQLWTAHHLTLEAQNERIAAFDGQPGSEVGSPSSQSGGGGSVGYDTGTSTDLDAGHWNSTNYGTRFKRLSRMIGSGGWQL